MYDNWKELVTDIKLDNQELRSTINELCNELNKVKRENCDLRMSLVFAKRKLSVGGYTIEPVEVERDRYECPTCCVTLEGDWEYCSGCGSYIDWDAIDNQENWYAEEGERFLQDAVYEPLRQVLQK